MCNLCVRCICTFINTFNVNVLSKFKESKSALNYSFCWPKTILRSFGNCISFGLVINILISSANKVKIALCSMALGESLM